MMRCLKTNSIDAMFDPPKENDNSVIASMYHQLRASSNQDVSLADDTVFRFPNEFIPQDPLTLLRDIEIEMPSDLPFNAASDLPAEHVSKWSLYSSDLEPTPIKPDLHRERVTASFDEKVLCNPDQVISAFVPNESKSADCSGLAGVKRESSASLPPTRPKKRFKTSREEKKRKSKNPPVFRPYQQQQFQEQFDELLKFKEEFGHCLVPHSYEPNQSLSRWVKRQRYQYKMLQQDKTEESTMTPERIYLLESIGFVWDSHKLAWQDRLKELEEYKKKNGDCNVPSTYRDNAALATWVKCQRRQYKRFYSGEASNISLDRITSLDALGFNWERRH
ncbi:unnamed protein product [Cylindrotheca closterium]|uniref:Helicase-associated domain-containing protein n=1 Tax=Cylindrotheca closterium TaxID=2856 RepID=A0AAD2G847_9STRA|nr:unnamed protein product [Cylindrotheca closterium]